MPGDLSCSWCHNNRNKCNTLESSWKHSSSPPIPGNIVFHETCSWCKNGWDHGLRGWLQREFSVGSRALLCLQGQSETSAVKLGVWVGKAWVHVLRLCFSDHPGYLTVLIWLVVKQLEFILLKVWRLKVPEQGVSIVKFWWALSSWQADDIFSICPRVASSWFMSAERSEKLSDIFPPVPLLVGVQLVSRVWLFVTPWTAAGQASLSFSISLGVFSNSCPFSRWCHPTISSSATPFSSYSQSFPASGSFPVSQLFTSSGQSIEAWVTLLIRALILLNEDPILTTSLNLNYVFKGPSLKTANLGFKGFKLCIWEIQPFCPQHFLKCGFWFRISV